MFAGVAFLMLAMSELNGAAAPNVVMVVPHTHWEGAVFKTREEYLEVGLPNIEKALYLLKKYPEYRFVLDQMCYVRPFLERYPAEIPAFRRFLSEGRLQIAGGTDTMHDNNIPSGESIVRQYLLSKSYFRGVLDYDVTTGWGLDTFGHNAQMPQILKLAGMKSYWFQRGVPGDKTPSEFLWKGIDGTTVPAFWLPISYAALFNIPQNEAEFSDLVRNRYAQLTPFSRGNERVLMAGADVWEPEEALPVMVDRFNKSEHAPFRLQLATPAEFEARVNQRSDRPVIEGELNPVFQGIYSSRIEVKQAMRNSERLLTTAEKFEVMASVVDGGTASPAATERAWEPVLFNQAHDLSSGVMVDKVYEDSMDRYHFSQKLAQEAIRESLNSIEGRMNTAGKGIPVAVFNTLGWRRTDIAEVDLAFSDPLVRSFALLDGQGRVVPVQFVHVDRNDDGGIRQARVAFIAQDIPALGYAVYHAVPGVADDPEPVAVHNTKREDAATLENEFYRAAFNLWTGEMTSLVEKQGNWEVLAGPGNVVARESDGGDFWELYGTLNGGRFTAMTKPILMPRPAYTQWSRDFVGGSGTVENGPVFSEFRITHPFGKNQFGTTVRMYNGVRRIDITTNLTNEEELVRYRVVFPTTIHDGSAMEEIPFGAIKRPEKQEFPAQNWMDYGNESRGVSLLNRGLPGNNVADGTMMLSLMRSARLISYGFIGGYEQGVGSDTGLGIGRRYSLEYAIAPHSGSWQNAAPWRSGLEFNNPLMAEMLAPHSGGMPARWGLLDVAADNVVISAVKPGKGGNTIVRVYEAAGRQARGVRLRFPVRVEQVNEANLIEDLAGTVTVSGDSFGFDLHPFEITTFSVKLRARR